MVFQQDVVHGLVSIAVEHPLRAVLTLFSLVCICTRLWTGYDFSRRQAKDGPQAREPAVLPYWLPYLGHVFPYLRDSKQLLRAARYHIGQWE